MNTLAAKITLPFLALFTALLLGLGAILAHEILAEVERRVEADQRLVLEVAAYPGVSVSDDTLLRIRDTAAAGEAAASSAATELIVLQEGARPLSTLPTDGARERKLQAFERLIKEVPKYDPHDKTPMQERIVWDEREWLMVAALRAQSRVTPNDPPRRFFLLHPYAEILDAKNRALWRLCQLGAVGLALAAILGLVLARWIARPVRRLAAAARGVTAQGALALRGPLRLDARDLNDGGEIGQLASAFASMLESLRASQAELVKAERLAAVGKLAANVAHEIRNPLTGLRMTLEVIQSRQRAQFDGDPQAAQAFGIMFGEIDRLSLSIGRLLTFCNPRPAAKAPVDLRELLRETGEFLAPQLQHAHVTLKQELDPDVPSMVALDRDKIRQVLVNLILNAQQAIVRNGEITLRAKRDGERIALEVHDTGRGVPPELGEKIWDVFVSSKQEGGGLGLPIVRQIVEEHGGTISFVSKPGDTTFRVTLPGS